MTPEEEKMIAVKRAQVDQSRAEARQYFTEHPDMLIVVSKLLAHRNNEEAALHGKNLAKLHKDIRSIVIRLASLGLIGVMDSMMEAEASAD